MPTCSYCESSQLTLRFQGMVHPYKKNHGPFDIYRCNDCFSLITFPLPSKKQQAELYAGFKNGLIPALGNMREQYELTSWYDQCIDRAIKQMNPRPSIDSPLQWIDVGAGGGYLAKAMAKRFPHSKGWALDFHERPSALDNIPNIEWIQCDLNEENFANGLKHIDADIVFSITVLEHIMHPEVFLKNLLGLTVHPGVFYLTVPCTHSFTSRLLGKKWPYFIPGEHLTVPSKKGMHFLVQRCASAIKNRHSLYVKETILPYTAGYYLSFLKLNFLKRIIPSQLPIRIPTGIIEAGMVIQ